MFKYVSIIIVTITLLAAILGISNWIIKQFSISNPKERKKRIIFFLIITIIVLLTVTFLYIEYGSKIFNPPTEPEPKEIIDISGTYSGYFVDELGKQIPTYLKIEFDIYSDSIKLYFKNTFSINCNAEYFKEERVLVIETIGKGNVKQEKGFVIIESQENNENKWIFTKDLLNY